MTHPAGAPVPGAPARKGPRQGLSFVLSLLGGGELATAKSAGWLIADKVVRLPVALVIGVWILRTLGPERFGALSYATAFAALFTSIAALGLENIVVRELVKKEEQYAEVMGSALTLRLAGGAVALVLAVAATWVVRPGDASTRWLVGIVAGASIFAAFDVIEGWFLARVSAHAPIKAKAVPFVLTTLGRAILCLLGASVFAFAWISLLEAALTALALLWALRVSRGRAQAWRFSKHEARALLRDSWPLIISSVVIMIYMRIDQVMLGELAGDREVGVYSAAVRLAEVWYLLPMAIVPAWLPSVVAARAEGEAQLEARMLRLYRLMVFLGYAVAIPTTLLAEPVVLILLGEGYGAAAPMLIALIWSIVFTNLGVARSAYLTAMNWTRVHLLTVLFGGVLNIALNFYAIPRFGGLGAAVASLVAYWAAAHGACLFYRPLWPTAGAMTRALIYPRFW